MQTLARNDLLLASRFIGVIPMATIIESVLHEQLLERRQKLEDAIALSAQNSELRRLLREVDAAMERVEQGIYGLCEACHDPIETERLLADPLIRFCLGDLTLSQQRALEEDLELAARMQGELLPKSNLHLDGWEISYHYEPAGPVSGDYCDLISLSDGSFYFMLGDVSGKGVAASMLMNQLHAVFHSLIPVGLPLNQLVERASRVFCESTLPTHFATLVCGKANGAGEIEICNAGHLPPLLIRNGSVVAIEANGLPVGVFCDELFSSSIMRLEQGDTLFLYTDGLSETQNAAGVEYGTERLSSFISERHMLPTEMLVRACVEEVAQFRAQRLKSDDLTIMTIRRNGQHPVG